MDVGVLLDWKEHPEEKERFDTRVRLTADMMHALSENQVDLVVLNDVSPELGRKIVRDGVRVFCADDSSSVWRSRHLEHLRKLAPKVTHKQDLVRDLSLHNDVLFSLLTVRQLLIDVAGQLSADRGLRFDDYTQAVMNLAAYEEFPGELVEELEPLPGFRNVVLHEYVHLDLDRVVDALQRLEPLEEFAERLGELVEGEDF